MKTEEVKKLSKHQLLLRAVLCFFILFFGYSVGTWPHKHNYEECTYRFKFLNPVFACLEEITINKKAYIDLKINLMSYIEEEKKSGRLKDAGIFFRDLEAGPTLGINDRTDFVPASLLKLPNVLTLFRLQEEELPNILSHKLMYKGNTEANLNKQEFIPEEIIQPNVPYTVYELIERSLIYSDNVATTLLSEYLDSLSGPGDLVAETFRDLGIINDYRMDASVVGVKAYSSIFRLLYNSSFLNKENSEKLLSILSRSKFKDGLRAGVPKDVIVASKFGERTMLNPNEKQLHGCGIIYYPTNPYLLCVMTKGDDFNELKNVIAHISREVYQEFDSRRLK